MQKAMWSTAAATAILALSGCATNPVTTDVNPNMSVAICHTYAFAPEHYGGPHTPYANPVNADRLRTAIEANLAAHGIRRAADPRSADCVVGYAIGSRVVANEYAGWSWGFGWGGGWGWGPPWGPGPGPWGGWGYDAPVVNEGRISVDLFDAKTHKAIWHASIDRNVTDMTGPDAEVRIQHAVTEIFAKFPVPAVAPANSSQPVT
ncbi:MAG TPA: DUF4136 domain-containing protein [Steroidobacteraceae bacterium]|nr:DUF4136 domain-containing protein [Steroidobacteraceae bacterium]